MRHNIFQIVSGFVFIIAAGGCWGPRQYDVTGQVKYNGSPLNKPDGVIVFAGPNETQVTASIGPDGTYRATKVTAGLNRIAIYYPNPALQRDKRLFARPKMGEPAPPLTAAPAPFLTPLRYASVNTSQLSVQVEEGAVFDVNMTGPPIP